MLISQSVLEGSMKLLQQFEGYSSKVYRCPSGVPTIGIGHALHAINNKFLNLEDALEVLGHDIISVVIDLYFNSDLRLNAFWPNQQIAIISFVFNFGITKFKSYTLYKELVKLQEDPDCEYMVSYVGDLFNKYVYSGKNKLPGLVKRREYEYKLFTHQLKLI